MTNLTELKQYLLSKLATTEETPFGPDVWVYKVKGKMFALVPCDANPLSISLKANPARAIELRLVFPAVTPGYHLNKKHWNTVTLDGTVPSEEVCAMIDESYRLVVAGLPRAERVGLTG